MSAFDLDLADYLAQISPGEVKAFLWGQVPSILGQLELTDIGDRQLVVHLWERLPQPENLISDILQTLARAAYGLWPAWYGQEALSLEKIQDWQQAFPSVQLPWLKQAIRACRADRVPILADFSRAVQLSQLLQAIAPHHVVIVVIVADLEPARHQLLGLAQAVQWLADKTQAPIALILPEPLSRLIELDSVLYGAISLSAAASTLTAESPTVPIATATATTKTPTGESTASEETKHILVPVRGRPHPFSPGEQLLAARLAGDAELGPLFQFNQIVKTICNSPYLVDLLWAEGQLVVEVDGYRYHSNQFAFSRDRHRDYELLLSGYVVLRLPHDEVVSGVEMAVEKIRNVVQFRRQTRPNMRFISEQ